MADKETVAPWQYWLLHTGIGWGMAPESPAVPYWPVSAPLVTEDEADGQDRLSYAGVGQVVAAESPAVPLWPISAPLVTKYEAAREVAGHGPTYTIVPPRRFGLAFE